MKQIGGAFLIIKNPDGSWPKCQQCNKYIPVSTKLKKKYCDSKCSRAAAVDRRRQKLIEAGHVFVNRGKVNEWSVGRQK